MNSSQLIAFQEAIHRPFEFSRDFIAIRNRISLCRDNQLSRGDRQDAIRNIESHIRIVERCILEILCGKPHYILTSVESSHNRITGVFHIVQGISLTAARNIKALYNLFLAIVFRSKVVTNNRNNNLVIVSNNGQLAINRAHNVIRIGFVIDRCGNRIVTGVFTGFTLQGNALQHVFNTIEGS